MRHETGTILAVDSDPSLEQLAAIKPHVDGVKVGLPLLLGRGPDHLVSIADVFDGDHGVVFDLKLADIPAINAASVERCLELGATHVICHGFVGSDSVRAVVKASDGRAFVVVEMSHPGGAKFFNPVAEPLIQVATKADAFGIVAPATRPERVAELAGLAGELKIATPGVGAQGGSAEEVREAGADWIIVGRSILTADDPVEAARELSLAD